MVSVDLFIYVFSYFQLSRHRRDHSAQCGRDAEWRNFVQAFLSVFERLVDHEKVLKLSNCESTLWEDCFIFTPAPNKNMCTWSVHFQVFWSPLANFSNFVPLMSRAGQKCPGQIRKPFYVGGHSWLAGGVDQVSVRSEKNSMIMMTSCDKHCQIIHSGYDCSFVVWWMITK